MRIAFDNIIFALQGQGGISNYWKELLGRSPADSQVLTHAVDGQNQCWVDSSKRFRAQTQASLPASVDRYLPVFGLHEDVNIFHSSYYRVPWKRILTVQSAYDFVYERYRSGIPKAVHSAQKFLALRGADAICCISQSTRSDLINHYGAPFESKSYVTHLAAAEIYRPIAGAREILANEEKYSFLGERRPFLLFVGARRPNHRVPLDKSYKRFDLAVISMQGLKDYDLIIIGGEPWGADDQALTDKYGVSLQIRAVGGVPQLELPLWYNAASGLLYLSDYEGFGLPVLEAAQCHCPVIAQNSSSIPEVHGDRYFLLDGATEDQVVSRVRWLENLNNKETLVNACAVHSKQFSWDHTWQATAAVYAGLL